MSPLDKVLKDLEKHHKARQTEQILNNRYAINDPLEGDFIYGNDLNALIEEAKGYRAKNPKTKVVRLSDRKVMF